MISGVAQDIIGARYTGDDAQRAFDETPMSPASRGST
jgi:hypothetical protein